MNTCLCVDSFVLYSVLYRFLFNVKLSLVCTRWTFDNCFYMYLWKPHTITPIYMDDCTDTVHTFLSVTQRGKKQYELHKVHMMLNTWS